MRPVSQTLPEEGLLVGWSLEPGRRRPVFGFETHQDEGGSPGRALEPIVDNSESHLITVAPTGAGKGVGAIIPALLRYRGPVVVVDPKGENFAVTARARRAMGQEVVVFDPFNIADCETRHRFNPLDLANPESPTFVEDAATLAQLASTNHGDRSGRQDPFWPQMGRTLVTAALLDVLTMPDSDTPTLPGAREVINLPLSDLAKRAQAWRSAEHPELRRMAGLLNQPADNTLGGYWAMAVNQLDFLKGGQVAEHLSASDLDLNKVLEGAPLSIYLILPPDKLESHSPLLRLWIGTLTAAITRRRRHPRRSTLFLIDEAAQLGALPQLRQAITLLRGYGVRIWSFWQDLSQIKHLYPGDWETILNNCRTQQFFGAATALAADAIAEASGYSPREAVLELDRDEMILNLQGDDPVIARIPNYRKDPPFKGTFDENPFYVKSTERSDVRARPVFRRTQSPAKRRKERTLQERMALARELFHPVARKHWIEITGADRLQRLDQAGIEAEEARAEDGLRVRVCELDFYEHHDWVEISDHGHSPSLTSYALLSPLGECEVLGGSARPMRLINRDDPPMLAANNIALYLDLYTSSICSEDGRFLIIDKIEEIEWRERPDTSILSELRAEIYSPYVVSGKQEEDFIVNAVILYGEELSEVQFNVKPNGLVNIIAEREIASNLDVIPDKLRIFYIGRFDRNGRFQAFF